MVRSAAGLVVSSMVSMSNHQPNGEFHTRDGILPEVEQVVVEELTAVALVLDPLSLGT